MDSVANSPLRPIPLGLEHPVEPKRQLKEILELDFVDEEVPPPPCSNSPFFLLAPSLFLTLSTDWRRREKSGM